MTPANPDALIKTLRDGGQCSDRVGAQEVCMRRSMAQKIAHSNLIEAVRAALQPEGERSDA